MAATGSITNDEGTTRTNRTIEFSAKAVLIQGFYGLEAAPPRTTTPPREPIMLPDTTASEADVSPPGPEDDLMLEFDEQDDTE